MEENLSLGQSCELVRAAAQLGGGRGGGEAEGAGLTAECRPALPPPHLQYSAVQSVQRSAAVHLQRHQARLDRLEQGDRLAVGQPLHSTVVLTALLYSVLRYLDCQSVH